MIGSVLLALQLAAAGQPIAVRDDVRELSVPVASGEHGPLLHVQALDPLLPTTVRALAERRFEVTLAGVTIALVEEAPFARIGSAVLPLAASPVIREGMLAVPVQLLTDILPRYSKMVRYDARLRELRVLRPAAAPPAVAGGTASPTMARPAQPGRTDRPKRRTVVVDAGHGGTDPGTGSSFGGGVRLVEKEVTLEVARRLRQALVQRGLGVVMTRDRDTLIALSDRGRIANERHGDLFISIHVNAPSPRWRNPESVRGFETYFLAEAKTEDAKRVEEMENQSIRFETEAAAIDDDALSFIIADMAQNEHLRESSDLAEKIQRHLNATHPGPNRGVRQAGFRVLVTAYMPAVLVEIGFATNRAEAEYLKSAAGQRAIAEAIADAAVAYLQHYERRVSSTAAP